MTVAPLTVFTGFSSVCSLTLSATCYFLPKKVEMELNLGWIITKLIISLVYNTCSQRRRRCSGVGPREYVSITGNALSFIPPQAAKYLILLSQ